MKKPIGDTVPDRTDGNEEISKQNTEISREENSLQA
jgi:hypothetical protein